MTLGATPTANGCDFSVYSDVDPANSRVTLCLLDGSGTRVASCVAMEMAGNGMWQISAPGVAPGQRYGYLVQRPGDPVPGEGDASPPVLLDPYARAFAPSPFPQPRQLHSLVVAPSDPPPPCERQPLERTVIYETHVKGMTRLHPDLDPAVRGTFRGLASDVVIQHLKNLGVTAVELLPVHQFVSEQFLLDQGLTDYWGYASIGFFAPHGAYSSAGALGAQVGEFKSMVAALHGAGLEVILDVVFNHTGEGGDDAPPLCFRGLADDVYYWLNPTGKYIDITGTGNTLDTVQNTVRRLIIDSLTYWVDEMGVDGFRFDEAGALARFSDGPSSFLDDVNTFIAGHPGIKLIAEPWRVGEWDMGRFPEGWREWNSDFRDGVPDFWARRIGLKWQGGPGVGDWLTGSGGRFGARAPLASVNFAACHDGLTAADKVASDADMALPANTANTEAISQDLFERRRRRLRNLVGTTLISQGVPMLLGGDELGRSQDGNANAYNQDNPVSWYDWTGSGAKQAMQAFVGTVTRLRANLPALRRSADLDATTSAWYDLDGEPMSQDKWDDGNRHGVALWIAGTGGGGDDRDVFVILNAGDSSAAFTIPVDRGSWEIQIDSNTPDGSPSPGRLEPGKPLRVTAETLLVLAAAR